MKLITDLKEFITFDPQIEKYIAGFFSGIFTFLHFILAPLVANQYFIGLLTLMVMDTIAGAYLTVKANTFTWKEFFRKPIVTSLEYGIYIAIAAIVSTAPLKMAVIPITAGIVTYVFLRLGVSVLKKTSKIFNNQEMTDLSNRAEDTLEDIINRNNDSNQRNS